MAAVSPATTMYDQASRQGGDSVIFSGGAVIVFMSQYY